MGHIKDILIMSACLLFVVYVFFSADYKGGDGVFENIGSVYAPIIENPELKLEGLNLIREEIDSDEAEVKYKAGVRYVGDCIKFRDLFEVKTENDLALYLMDITRSGRSVLELLSSEDVEALEEIPAPFVYDKDQDLLYIFGSGIYTVKIKVYGSSGGTDIYEFQLPVEL